MPIFSYAPNIRYILEKEENLYIILYLLILILLFDNFYWSNWFFFEVWSKNYFITFLSLDHDRELIKKFVMV